MKLPFLALLFCLAWAGGEARAAPVKTQASSQKIKINVRKVQGTGVVLKKGLSAKLQTAGIQWEYIPNTPVSVAYFSLLLSGIPDGSQYTVMANRSAKLKPDAAGNYLIQIPLLNLSNVLMVTIVDQDGKFEDWSVELAVTLSESAVFVDETCVDYVFKIREIRRPKVPNLMYIGCRAGSGPGEMSLDILWAELDRAEYFGKVIRTESSILTVPLESHRTATQRIMGYSTSNEQSIYEVEYQPFSPPPFEVWAGTAFFHTAFSQSNFPAKFTQASTAFLGTFWYRPEDVRLSLMLRGFGSLFSFSQKLDPDQGYQEGASTYFVDAEMRYSVLDNGNWRVSPFIGGWVFFMNVDSRNFGVQRIIDPIIGLAVKKTIRKHDELGATVRFVPLQSYFNPAAFALSQSYLEFELTYMHPLRKRNRVFGTLYSGSLNYAPDGFAATAGNYLVIGGGYGW